MIIRRKFIITAVGTVIATIAVPVIWSAFGANAYFYDGRCICGHDSFVRIAGNGYFSYSPGHGVPEHQKFKIGKIADGWAVLGLPHSDKYWSPLEGEDKVIAYLRLGGGALYDSWDGGKNWDRHPRVYNVWRVWAAKVSERFFSPNQPIASANPCSLSRSVLVRPVVLALSVNA